MMFFILYSKHKNPLKLNFSEKCERKNIILKKVPCKNVSKFRMHRHFSSLIIFTIVGKFAKKLQTRKLSHGKVS